MAEKMEWRCYSPGLFKELQECAFQQKGTWILAKPFEIFTSLISEVAERCAEVNDPVLNDLMCKLGMYEIADPYSENYDWEMVKQVEGLAKKTAQEVCHAC